MSERDQVVFSSKPWVGRVLIERINPSIPDGHTLKVYPRIVVELEVAGNVRNVVASVTLTSYVEGPLLVLRILVHEVVEEGRKVGCNGFL